jgi:hypothetical protein
MTRLTLIAGIAGMAAIAVLPVRLTAATQPAHQHPDARAHHGMGFDQKTSTHHFLIERTGGTIEVTATPSAPPESADQIRAHLEHIATAFAAGDFSLPMFIHDTEPPGVATMKARRQAMKFRYQRLERGGRVVIRTNDGEALAALHEFLRFQIREHRTGDPTSPK